MIPSPLTVSPAVAQPTLGPCLSTLMPDILMALKTCAGNSRYILPSRYDADAPMSRAAFNRVTSAIAEQAWLLCLNSQLCRSLRPASTGSHQWIPSGNFCSTN